MRLTGILSTSVLPAVSFVRFAGACLAAGLLLAACDLPWNHPYPRGERGGNLLYSAFVERPKHLDPVQSYSSDEIDFTAQIYEPPLQYHYLKRPYHVVPGAAREMPKVEHLGADGTPLSEDAPASAATYTRYTIAVRPGIQYQPHPAFVRRGNGGFRYYPLKRIDLAGVHALSDFSETATRELVADDYIYQIKRLAHPRLHSPIFGLMSDNIVGLKDLGGALRKYQAELPAGSRDEWIDLRRFPLKGVEKVDSHTYRVTLRGRYPQFLYWLTMPFFAPIPWEADRFYSQPGFAEKNLTLDWYPVGTGPFMLTENNPNARMVLRRNPHYRGEKYPCEGEADDAQRGLLKDCGKTVPFLDGAVFVREKEAIPYWNKFLQGYYDASAISSDSFDQAVQISGQGDITLTDEMREQGIRLQTSVSASVFYMGFNMRDPLVGGRLDDARDRERARKLRQAIAIAIDQEEFIAIFQNGRGIPAMSPIPPGIFGHREGEAGLDGAVYDWVDGAPRRKPVSEARRLLAEAGYPEGRNARTGEPLVIHLDTTGTGVGAKSRVDWLTKQFRKIDVQLVVRSTDYNRFQEKVRKGAVQLFYYGWNADYPDPENFLFLLYGKEAKVEGGQNGANYSNPEYDRLFEQMRAMDNGPQRQQLIDRMLAILHHDVPWVWGYHPKSYALEHQWKHNTKPSNVGNNGLKYVRLDAATREGLRRDWNQPVWWPFALLGLGVVAVAAPAVTAWRRRERAIARHDPGQGAAAD